MSDGEHGQGAKLLYGTVTNPTSWTAIGNIMSITGPSQTRDPIDISTMESTSKFREFLPGMLDAGEVTMDINYDGSASGEANALNGTAGIFTASAYTFGVSFGDGTNTVVTNNSYWYSGGFMTALGHAIPFDDKITQPITIKFTGVRTYVDLAP